MIVVKVQLSQMPYHTSYLAYDEARSVVAQGDVTKHILRAMGKHEKRFFYAMYDGQTLALGKPTTRQDYEW